MTLKLQDPFSFHLTPLRKISAGCRAMRGYRALEAEEQALADARQAGKRAVWNHREFEVEYAPAGPVLKIGEVHVDYLFDHADDAKAVESVADPRGFFEQLYLHVVFALAGVQPSTAQVRPSCCPRSLSCICFCSTCMTCLLLLVCSRRLRTCACYSAPAVCCQQGCPGSKRRARARWRPSTTCTWPPSARCHGFCTSSPSWTMPTPLHEALVPFLLFLVAPECSAQASLWAAVAPECSAQASLRAAEPRHSPEISRMQCVQKQ